MSLWSRWKKSQRGSIAVIFALSLLPTTLSVGGAMDYAKVIGAKTRLQGATDALSHAMARESKLGTYTGTSASASNTSSGSNPRLESYFTSNFVMTDYTDFNWWSWTSTKDSNAKTFTVTSRAGIKTSFLQIFGILEISSGASSAAAYQSDPTPAEIVLVMGNSSSMTGSRMTALKSAASSFMDIIETANGATNGIVKVSVVPYQEVVDLSTSYYNVWWLNSSNVSGSSDWTGCIDDRGSSYLTSTPAPVSGTANTKHLALSVYYDEFDCPSSDIAMLRLPTNTFSDVRTTINAMVGKYDVNTMLAMTWAWNFLTPGFPIGGSSSDSSVKKFVVFVADNINTSGYNRHGLSQTTVDSNTQTICTNMKNLNIRIFTIKLIGGTASLMSSCASSAGDYYNLTSTTNLTSTFQAIANTITQEQLTN